MRAISFLILTSYLLGGGPSFNSHFTGATMRLDYTHTGVATDEHFSLDRVKIEGPWPGRRENLIDKSNLSPYRFVIADRATGAVLFSEGFASIYGEWETTREAQNNIWRGFSESLRFPEPKRPIKISVKKRNSEGRFRSIYEVEIDPGSRIVDRSKIGKRGTLWTLMDNGPVASKVDILVLGDGYRGKDKKRFHKDVERLIGQLFDTEPFKSRQSDFNVRAIDLPAQEAGISRPRSGEWRDSPLGLSYNAFDSERYMLTYDNVTVRDVAAQAPYDAVIMIANSDKYGGGGIYNLYATTVAHSTQSAYVMIHEFGHSFAGLGDEYYSSSVAYIENEGAIIEPWAPNITALLTPDRLKWRAKVDGATPIPTPWNQADFDTLANEIQRRRDVLRLSKAPESSLDALFAEEKSYKDSLLASEPYFGQVGAFEGAQYQGKGLYRPEANCIMFTRYSHFCAVCSAAIERRIDSFIN